MRKIWLALILTVSMSISPVAVWATSEEENVDSKVENTDNVNMGDDSWDSFVEIINENFINSYNKIKDASVQLKESGDKNGFIERLKKCIDSEKKDLQIYEKQSVGDEGSNYNFVQDTYVNGTDKMAEALSAVTEEDLSNPESEFWKKWKDGNSKRYDVIMELYYYLGDDSLDGETIQEIHDKYYKNMILNYDNESISELQTKLGIEADGNIGSDTLRALKTWQENNNEVVRGIVTRELINSIL
mgnify:FL=1